MEHKDEMRALFDGKLLIEIPDSFQEAEGEKAANMFPYEERPQIILEEKGTSRFCTFSLLEKQSLTKNQTKHVIDLIADAVISLYPSCLLEQPGLVKREEAVYGWFAFQTSAREGKLYNIMYICPVNGSMLLGTMGCLMDDEAGRTGMQQQLGTLKIPERRPARAKISVALPRKRS